MGEVSQVAIKEGTHHIACAQAVNVTVSIFKCLQPQLDIFVDDLLKGL
jgi:hypothetical protein